MMSRYVVVTFMPVRENEFERLSLLFNTCEETLATAISRGAHDAQLFTNHRERLPVALGHEVPRESAHSPKRTRDQAVEPSKQEIAPRQEDSYALGLSL